MRKNQMSVTVKRFGDQIPKDFKPPEKGVLYRIEYDKSDEPLQIISVYADANNFYETWCAAFNETVQEIQRHESLCKKNELLTGKNQVDIFVHLAYFNDNWVDYFKNKRFSASSTNVYKALTDAFNKVLFESQKHVMLPTFGRKEHYPGADERIRIFACHAGTGKTTLAKQYPDKFTDFVCIPFKYYLPEDFDGNEDESRKADFNNEMREDYPQNYFKAIKKEFEQSDKTLLVPPDRKLLGILRKEDIPYLLCYPQNSDEAKEAYHKRFLDRGNTEDFIDIFIGGWNRFMNFLENDQYGFHVIMKPDQYLSDVVRTDRPIYR